MLRETSTVHVLPGKIACLGKMNTYKSAPSSCITGPSFNRGLHGRGYVLQTCLVVSRHSLKKVQVVTTVELEQIPFLSWEGLEALQTEHLLKVILISLMARIFGCMALACAALHGFTFMHNYLCMKASNCS